MLCNGYRDLVTYRVDLQAAIHNHEFHVGEVAVCVREVRCLELHRILSDFSSLDCGVAAEANVCFLVQLVVNGHIIAGHSLLFAVISLGLAVLCNGYRDLVTYRGNNQCALQALIYNIIVILADCANGIPAKLDIIPSGICAFTVGRNSFEYSSGIICRIAINRFQLAVIGHAVAVGLEGYILVQFENDHICRFIRSNCDTLGFIALQRIILRSGGRYSNLVTESLSGMLNGVNHLIVPLVHHSIAQVGALAPASGKGNVMIRHCEEAVCVDRYILSGPAAENVACQFRSFCSRYLAVYGFR